MYLRINQGTHRSEWSVLHLLTEYSVLNTVAVTLERILNSYLINKLALLSDVITSVSKMGSIVNYIISRASWWGTS